MQTEIVEVTGHELENVVHKLNSKIKEKEADGFEVASVNHVVLSIPMREPEISMYAVLQKGF